MPYHIASRPTRTGAPVRRRALMDRRVGIVLLRGGARACRANEGGRRADSARAAESTAGAARSPAPPPTVDSSPGAVASPAAPSTTPAGVRRDSSAATPPLAAATTAASKAPPTPADTMQRGREARAATTRRETPTARPDSAAAARRTAAAPSRTAARDSAPPAKDSAPANRPTAPAAAPAPARADSTQQPGADKLAVNQSEYNGWKTFAVNCTRCHGEDAIGSTIAPSLVKSLRETVTHEVFVQTVTNGRPDKGMPTWGPLLSDKQIEDLYAYLKARSEGRLAPGRPHVKSGS